MSGSEIRMNMNMNNQSTQSLHKAYGGGDGDGSAVYQGNGEGEQLKKKRGRPRKYGPDGGMAAPLPLSAQPQPSGTFSHAPHAAPPPPSAPQPPPQQPTQAIVTFSKSRGRPSGSSKKHRVETLGSPGINFTPHVITVKAGEDVASKIMSFSQNGPRSICILSANGAISSVTLRQAATSGGSVTYEGRFEILSLSGSFMVSDNNEGQRGGRSGSLSVSLASSDGRVLGGGVAGILTAASPVQVIVGSFFPDYRREMNLGNQIEASSKHHNSGMGQGSPPSRGTLSESSAGGGGGGGGGGPGSPLNQQSTVNSAPHGMHGLPWK